MPSSTKTKKVAKKLAVSTLIGVGAGLTVFQQFALAATFDQASYDAFVSSAKTAQQSVPQTLNSNRHNDAAPHYHDSWHDNDAPHTDTHSDYDTAPYQNTDDGHYDHDKTTAEHEEAFVHTNGSHQQGHWDDVTSLPNHSNYGGNHGDKYYQHSVHTNKTTHNNTNPHDNYYPHTNDGFDHDNYVPSQPQFFNLAGQQLSGIAKIALYSYDKNADGVGTQDSYSRDVLYTVQIRRTKNLDGTANVSAWRTLVTEAPVADGKLVLDLNTIDPLGTGNVNPKATEGIYEIKATALNRLIYTAFGKNYNVVQAAPAQTVTVTIKQNQSPTVSVTNGNEFVNFTFGFDGVLSPSSIYKVYADGLYAGADASQQEGLLVRVLMKDPDSAGTTQRQWQKGRIIVKSPGGTVVASANILWADTGTEITSSENTNKAGLAFIPKDAFVNTQDMKNAVVVVEVTDYTDAACSQPTGTVVQQTTVSATDLTTLNLSVDVTKPTVTASTTDYTWKKANISVGFTYVDLVSGIQIQEYQVTTTTDQPASGWLPYTGAIPITTDGQYYVHWHAKDKVGNEQYGYFGPYSLDKTPPTATCDQVDVDASTIRLDITASDNLSGVKRIKLPNGSYVNGATASYTVPAVETSYTFVIEDNAGNVFNYVHAVSLNPTVTNVRLIDIVNPPTGTTPPIGFPVGTPVRIKAGYQMTFEIQTKNADQLQIRALDGGGNPLLLHTTFGSGYTLTASTGSRADVTNNIAFWLDQYVPKNTVVTLEVTVIRIGTPNRQDVDTAFGHHFGIVVGSSLEDSGVNQTK